jgi:hypothetical protein
MMTQCGRQVGFSMSFRVARQSQVALECATMAASYLLEIIRRDLHDSTVALIEVDFADTIYFE